MLNIVAILAESVSKVTFLQSIGIGYCDIVKVSLIVAKPMLV